MRSTSCDRPCHALGCANVAIHAETRRHPASRWHTTRGGTAEPQPYKDGFGRVFACASGDEELRCPCRGRPGHATCAAGAGYGTGSTAWSCGGWARARRSRHRSSIHCFFVIRCTDDRYVITTGHARRDCVVAMRQGTRVVARDVYDYGGRSDWSQDTACEARSVSREVERRGGGAWEASAVMEALVGMALFDGMC